MGGFAGFTWGERPLLARMLRRLAHRGPQPGSGYVSDEVSLGSRVAADPVAPCVRPSSLTQGLRIAFDGEVYNRAELRAGLEARGHRLAGAGDAELVLHAFAESGPACLPELNGDFALALWDAAARRLFLARDRLGVRPLYYALAAGRLVFASEVKALLEWPGLARGVDSQALLSYLGYGFSPSPRTLFEGVQRVEPGHCLTFQDGRLTDHTWWDVPLYRGNSGRREAEDRLVSALEESVRLRLGGDDSAGILLSSGIDAGVLLALAASLDALPPTFSVADAEGGRQALESTRRLARHFGTEHHELVIEALGPEDVRAAAWALDEPLNDPSAIALHLVSRRARPRVPALLSAEGADELLCGYGRFRASRVAARLELLPRALRKGLLDYLADRLPDAGDRRNIRARLKRFARGARLPREGRHVRWHYFLPRERETLLRDRSRLGLADHDRFAPVRALWEASGHHRDLNRESYVDLKLLLPDSVLLKVDKASMAHALRVRLPFLDPTVVELTAPLPPRWKLDGGSSTAILRTSAARHRLLPAVLLRAATPGHRFPRASWLRGSLAEFMRDTFRGSRLLRELCDRAALERLAAEHLDGRGQHENLLWALLNLAVWHELYFESPPPPPSPAREERHRLRESSASGDGRHAAIS